MFRLAVWLSKNHQVSVWFIPGTPLYELAKQEGLDLKAIRLPKKYFDLLAARRLAQQLKAEKVQAVVASLNRDIDILAWTKALSQNRLKFIYFQQMLFPVKKKSILHDFRFTRIDAWLSPSEYLLNQVKMNTNILDEKLIKVPLGIETASFLQAKSKRADVKIEWGLSPDKNYIGLLGRIDPMKGQALLIEAFGRLKNRFPNWNLLFVGETSLHLKTDVYSKKVTEEINRQELTERVRFLPFTNEPWKFFAATDVFVLGSHEEAYGMVTVEALVSGTPVVGSDSGSTPELLGLGQIGILYKAKDAASLTLKLEEALMDFDALSAKAMEQRNELAAIFSHEKETAAIEKLLKQWGFNS